MFRTMWRSWQKGKSRAAKSGRLPKRKLRPALELLETRDLLSFGSPVSYNIGTQPSALNNSTGSDGVTTGDFRGIGLTDLAVVHTVDNTLNILLNNGDGTFRPAVSYPCPNMELGPVWVTAADLNGDGNLDLAVLGNHSNSALDGVIDIFLGNGDGTFRPAVSYNSGPGSRGGIAVGDFNGDGSPDLAVADFNYAGPYSFVGVLMNRGDGTFSAPQLVPVNFPAARSVTVGDFNGDGNADLAVADGLGVNGMLDQNYPAGVNILLGNGDGTFRAAGRYTSPATPGGGTVNPEFVTTGDLRHNGITDVIVCDYDHNLNVFLGNGDGSFQPAVGYDTGEYPRATSVVDVNGDGIPDLLVCNIGNSNVNPPEAGSVAVLLGNGDGTFQDPVQFTPFNYPGWLAVGDFTGNGLPDIAVTRVQDGHSINVLLNELVLHAIGDQTIPSTQQDLTVTLSAADANGTPITYSATGQSLAYVLWQQLGPLTYDPTSDNWGGQNEKWLQDGGGQWYFLLSDGGLYRWDGSGQATGALLGNVGASYYADPTRLLAPPADQPHATLSVSGNTLTISRDLAWISGMVVTVTASDGEFMDSKSFTVTVTG
jgi:FG-GAP-like repeat